MTNDANPLARVIARTWADPGFKARLIADPIATLKAEGVTMPDGVTVAVVENTADHVHLVLPPPPPEGEISDEGVGGMAVGGAACTGVPGMWWIYE